MKIFLRNIQITTVSSGSSVNIGKTLNVVRNMGEKSQEEGEYQEAETEITPLGSVLGAGLGPARGVRGN